ncbi:MAG: hypothetical protein JNL70_27330 [Saprospiraceae bacterium]|nr:hypothetical protein [Saprospiraceae bacterium]
MHTELLPNYVSEPISSTAKTEFETLTEQARSLYPKTPILDETTYKVLDKMGPTKRVEYDAKMPIFKKHKPKLSEPLSIETAENCIAIGDGAMAAALKLKEEAANLQRLAVISYAQGYNMLKCMEEDNDISASRKNETSIAVRTEINAIDKKKLAALAAEKARIENLANKIAEEKISKNTDKDS